MGGQRVGRHEAFVCFVAAVGVAAILVGCGGDGDGRRGTSTVAGNVSNAETAFQNSQSGWLAWVGQEVFGFAKRAWAQAEDGENGFDGSLEGIIVTATNGGSSRSTTTGPAGDFEIEGAPSGDLTVTFERGEDCAAGVPVSTVASGSTVILENVDFDCSAARPERIDETLERAVVSNRPDSPQGNFVVCVETEGGPRERSLMVRDAELADDEGNPVAFEDIESGDLIRAAGERRGQGDPSTLDADTVVLREKAVANPCAVPAEPEGEEEEELEQETQEGETQEEQPQAEEEMPEEQQQQTEEETPENAEA